MMTPQFIVHNLVAHPLLVLWPRVGEWLHDITAPASEPEPAPVRLLRQTPNGTTCPSCDSSGCASTLDGRDLGVCQTCKGNGLVCGAVSVAWGHICELPPRHIGNHINNTYSAGWGR